MEILKFIDMHCDTLELAYLNGESDIFRMPGMLDVERLKQGGALAQFFAIFMMTPTSRLIKGKNVIVEDEEYINTSMKVFYTTMENYGDFIAPAYNYEDMCSNEEKHKISAFLTFEDGRAIKGKMENLKKYYDKGIRLISLTWNFENCFGAPNSKDADIMNKGLTSFGKEAVEVMNELGILIDVSHLSDGGFMDVANISQKPFVASHSNCRALSSHERNLTDEMIRVLGEKGGVAGINFAPMFLNEDITCRDSTVNLMSKHICHMIKIGGEECVALGSDFDGIGGNLQVDGPDKMKLIFDRLSKDGLSDDLIEKIAYKNMTRVIKDVMK